MAEGVVSDPYCRFLTRAIRVDSPPGQGQSLVKQLTEYRHKFKLTHETLATWLGINLGTLKNWERGRTRPRKIFWKQILAQWTHWRDQTERSYWNNKERSRGRSLLGPLPASFAGVGDNYLFWERRKHVRAMTPNPASARVEGSGMVVIVMLLMLKLSAGSVRPVEAEL